MDHGTLDISISLHTAIFGQKLHNPSVKIVVMKEIAQNPLIKYFWNILKYAVMKFLVLKFTIMKLKVMKFTVIKFAIIRCIVKPDHIFINLNHR